MDTIGNVMDSSRFQQPEEVEIIKNFIQEHYASECLVTTSEHQIVIAVPGAALAGTLRFDLPQLKQMLNTPKKLIIRIGS